MVKGGGIGDFGGGQLEHPRRWPGANWRGLFPWECRAAQSRQAPPEEAQQPSWGAAKGGTLTTLPHPLLSDHGAYAVESVCIRERTTGGSLRRHSE